MSNTPQQTAKTVFVAGGTGYVGGRLVPMLLERGYRVRAAGRSIEKLRARPWGDHPALEPVACDVLDLESLTNALQGCDTAYYLVHSMGGRGDFAELDRKAAMNMVRASTNSSLSRIIYLSGLGEDSPELSHHLRSRAEVAEILQLGPVPVTVLRAAVIIGSGSASFEILRYLVDRLPVMTTPRWVHTKNQPIAVSDVLGYLTGCLENDDTAGKVLDIGGPEVITYRQLFDIYAEEAGLRRRIIIPLPFLTPGLSSHWINLVTPVPISLARPLVEGLKNEVVVQDDQIRTLLPRELLSPRQAIAGALDKVGRMAADTCCYDAGDSCVPEWNDCTDADYAGGDVCLCAFEVELDGSPETVWEPVSRLGGDTGWYWGDSLWKMRGALDKLVGGPGYMRGRRHPTDIRVGDHLDFWRVVDVRPGKRLLLLAEMKTPGQALLEYELSQTESGSTRLAMRAKFLPRGLAGLVYWYSMYPFHVPLFRNMLKKLAQAAEAPVIAGPHKER